LGIRRPYLLYVGGYEPHKNIPGLLRAFSQVKAVRPEVSLVLVGSKCLPDDLPAQAAQLGLRIGHDVVFLLNLTTDLTVLYDSAELFITLSWRETFCLPALEAMTRGRPVVASAWGATPEVVGDAGRLIDPRDHTGAADAMLDLLSSHDRVILVERAHRAAGRFDWAETARRTLSIYSRLAGRNGK